MYSKELEEKKNDLITRAEEVLNNAKAETRELTEDEAAELAEIRDNVRRIIETLKIKGEFDKMENKEIKEEPKVEVEMDREEQETRAFENYVRGVVVNNREGELTKAANGAVIPTTIANRIIRKVYDICPILERSSKYNVKGNLDLPYYDVDTTTINVAYQNEFSALSSSVGNFASIQLTGYLAGALVKISRSLINNAQFDIVAFIVEEMAYAIKRFIEHELLVGTSGKVTGLSTLTNSLTAASASAITADEVVKLQGKVKDDFQANAVWIMNPSTRDALRLLKDEMGRYLLQDDITSPFGKVLLGKPVYVSDNMPQIGSGATAIYYGDLRGLATKFSEEMNIEVLREKFADEHAVGVIGWLEFDSKVEDAQKIAKLVMAGQLPSA